MISTKYIRDNLTLIKESLKRRKSNYPIDDLLRFDEEWRKATTELQDLRAKKNKATFEISDTKKKGGDIKEKVAKLSAINKEIDDLEKRAAEYQEKIDKLLWNVPNVLDESVPIGVPPDANKILQTFGKVKNKPTPNHEEILNKLNLLDVERAAKISGARFYFLRGDLVLLEQSLIRYTLDKMASLGYTLITPPLMLKKKYYKGVAPLGVFEDALYRISEANEAAGLKDAEHMDEELFMISTAEHALAAMHAEELLAVKDLPIKYAGFSPSFRREAGAHGKDTKGIFRVHQFNKVEQFIYCKKEDEEKYFSELLSNSDNFFKELELPYQTVLLCSQDTGHQMTKTVDFEAWFPSQNAYRELGSCSSAKDWQSVRLDIKYDEKGERKYVYTLNNTAISMQRTLACIIENYYNEDGSITVPKVLVPYMGKRVIKKA